MAKTERSSAAPGDQTGNQVKAPAVKPVLAKSVSKRSATRQAISPNQAASKPACDIETLIATPIKRRSRSAKDVAITELATPEAPACARALTKPPRSKVAPIAAGASASRAKAQAAPEISEAAAPCAAVNLGYLSEFVGFHLRLAQDASYRAFARVKEKDLVKPGRFPALAIIHLNPGISQSALGRAIARDKSTVSPLIKDLQKNGLISRKPSPHDRRSVTLVLTKKGERVLEQLHERALEHEADLLRLIGASKARLVAMLDKITCGLGHVC